MRFHYGGVSAVDGVGLALGDGEIVGIIGSNGAGKTTLLDLCSGFLRPSSGRIRLDGEDVTTLTAAERAERGLGRSFQDARLFPSLRVSEVIATALDRHIEVRDPLLCALRTGAVSDSERAVAARVGELIDLLALGPYRDAFVSELSTGTRRVVELACALAHAPRVLLLDEPSSGIAQRESEALADLLLRVRRETGASLLVVEHDIPLVSSVADRLVCLELGATISEGPPHQVLADPLVVASYLGTDPLALARSGPRAPAVAQRRRSGRKPTAGPGRGVTPPAAPATSSTRP